jgi:hypothetical protein
MCSDCNYVALAMNKKKQSVKIGTKLSNKTFEQNFD